MSVGPAVVDHLVVAADTLASGVAWCESTLGITPGPGGQHPLMGTHNRLFKIATAQYTQAYFEIIAINPDAPAPGRPRWFGLDNPALQNRIRSQGPQFIHWVAATTNMSMHRWGLINVGHQPGEPLQISRPTPEGLLQWQMLVPGDGQPLCGGALPTLIQWASHHPTQGMPSSGVTLHSLHARGVPERARDVLRAAAVHVSAAQDGPALTAVLHTPKGPVTLTSAYS
jgi:Glyoxalase-like domain